MNYLTFGLRPPATDRPAFEKVFTGLNRKKGRETCLQFLIFPARDEKEFLPVGLGLFLYLDGTQESFPLAGAPDQVTPVH